MTCAVAMVALLGLSTPERIVRANSGSERAAVASGATSDIVTTAVEAGHFKTLTKALEAAGLVETLKGTGPFTVFAPSGDAFAKLTLRTLENLLKPEKKEKLSSPMGKTGRTGDV